MKTRLCFDSKSKQIEPISDEHMLHVNKQCSEVVVKHNFVFVDMVKIYYHPELDPDLGLQLQNKVQFDVQYYLLRRGLENMCEMKKKYV